MPEAAWSSERPGTDALPVPSGRAWLCRHLDWRRAGAGTGGYMAVSLNPQSAVLSDGGPRALTQGPSVTAVFTPRMFEGHSCCSEGQNATPVHVCAHCSSAQSLTDRHWVFYLMALVHSAVVNRGIQTALSVPTFGYWVMYPAEELLAHAVIRH